MDLAEEHDARIGGAAKDGLAGHGPASCRL
jgi:hypothetical protein